MNLTRRPDPAAAYPSRPIDSRPIDFRRIDFRPIDGPILSEGTPEWFSQRRPTPLARSLPIRVSRRLPGRPASFGLATAQTAEALDTFRYTTPRCNAEWE